MGDIQALAEINWFEWFVAGLLLLLGYKFVITLKDWFYNRYGIETKAMREKREDHELILANTQAIKDLAKLHKKDANVFNEHDDKMKEDLSVFMTEVKADIKRFTENRISDRAQSLEIQKELTDSIKTIVDSQKDRDEQIMALMCGSKELLGNTIDERYEKYINLNGVPQDEIDEFDSIYIAYKGLNGNSGRRTKYEYVKNHLPIIPVKTELLIKHN